MRIGIVVQPFFLCIFFNPLFMKKIVVVSAVIGLVFGFLGGAFGQLVFSLNLEPVVRSIEEKIFIEESSFTQAIEKIRPSVVSVILSKNIQIGGQSFNGIDPFMNDPFFRQFFGGNSPFVTPQPQQKNSSEKKKQRVGGGSGFIVTKEGLVVTNRHVVDDPDADYIVVLSDGQEFPAKLVSKDSLNDLAVIQILPKQGESKIPPLTPVVFGDSANLKVGQRVLAIGNALSEYQNTVTSGIVSGIGRQIVAGDGRGSSEALFGLLQTDAAINPGNSGGPLVNLAGEVIGVNVAVAASANGISFAIPVNDVKPVVESVEKTGKIVRPILGARYMLLTEDRAKELLLKGVTHGALLVSGDESQGEFAVVPGGAAEKAGLKKGDVILQVEGKDITPEYGLQESIRNKKPGDTVPMKVWSSGAVSDKIVTLGEAQN